MKTGKVKLVKIIYSDRPAGWSTVKPPPTEYVGRIGTVTRPLINPGVIGVRQFIDLYWVKFLDGKSFVLAEDELEEVADAT